MSKGAGFRVQDREKMRRTLAALQRSVVLLNSKCFPFFRGLRIRRQEPDRFAEARRDLAIACLLPSIPES